MSDLSAIDVGMANSVKRLVREFERSIMQAIEKLWPALVQAEIIRLSRSGFKPGLTREERAKHAAMLAAKGKSQGEIADLLGLSQPYVCQLLKLSKEGAKS